MKRNKQLTRAAVPTPQIQTQLQSLTISAELFAGPLPHPEVLRAYDEICPGAAKMILDKFEDQSDHRRNLESRALTSNIVQTFLGTFCAFIVLMTLIISGALLIDRGRDIGGLGAIAAGVCGAIYVFVKGKSAKAADLETKRGSAKK